MTHTQWKAMARAAVATTALGCLAIQVAGCDSDDGSNPDGGGGTGGGGTAVQLLTVTGPIAGTMTEATTQCEKFINFPTRLEVTLNGKVGTTDRRLKIIIHNYGGSGSYGGSAVQVDIAGTIASGDEASVAAGEKSGTIDSAMNTAGNKVTGSWSCASAPVIR
jgi:hypothetical protein